ncbi:hypothetical protein B0T10DRAFT_195958 [Thelonectria olida]|uniref:Uncharacterized protein n=1 Tax=Thelonectria olida TaxID=1576542 RepID=A0A9P8VTI0_9HYPO|nr:hypothetical protein B0T10DRAFT_195885 [Thelonectria olida]KAH6876863.1 hypothetical protein B0T10DRAFT_195958 [Thelonectria olida]
MPEACFLQYAVLTIMSAKNRLLNFRGTDSDYISFLEGCVNKIQEQHPELFESFVQSLPPPNSSRKDHTHTSDPSTETALNRKSNTDQPRTLRSRRVGAGSREQISGASISQNTRSRTANTRKTSATRSSKSSKSSKSCSEGTDSNNDSAAPSYPKVVSLDDGLALRQGGGLGRSTSGTNDTSIHKTHACDSRAGRAHAREVKPPGSPAQERAALQKGKCKVCPPAPVSEETNQDPNGPDSNDPDSNDPASNDPDSNDPASNDPASNKPWPHLNSIPRGDKEWEYKRKYYGLDTVKQIQTVISTLVSVNPISNSGGIKVPSYSPEDLGERIAKILQENARFDALTRLLVYIFFAYCFVIEYLITTHSDESAKHGQLLYDNEGKNNEQLLYKLLGGEWDSLKRLKKVPRKQAARKMINGWLKTVLGQVKRREHNLADGYIEKLKKGARNMIKTLNSIYEKQGADCIFELAVYYDVPLWELGQHSGAAFEDLQKDFMSALPSKNLRKSIPLGAAFLLRLWVPFSCVTICEALGFEHRNKERIEQFVRAWGNNCLQETYFPPSPACYAHPYTPIATTRTRSRCDGELDDQRRAKRRRTAYDPDTCHADVRTENDENDDQASPGSATASRTPARASLPAAEGSVSHSLVESSSQAPDISNNHDTGDNRVVECAQISGCEKGSPHGPNTCSGDVQPEADVRTGGSRALSRDADRRDEMQAEGGCAADKRSGPRPREGVCDMPVGNGDITAASTAASTAATTATATVIGIQAQADTSRQAQDDQRSPQAAPEGGATVASGDSHPPADVGDTVYDSNGEDGEEAAANALMGISNGIDTYGSFAAEIPPASFNWGGSSYLLTQSPTPPRDESRCEIVGNEHLRVGGDSQRTAAATQTDIEHLLAYTPSDSGWSALIDSGLFVDAADRDWLLLAGMSVGFDPMTVLEPLEATEESRA